MNPPSSSEAAAEVGIFPREGLLSDGALAQPLHLAVGMFDGVHIGHQAVIRQAIDAAWAGEGHLSGVLTFDPHPSRVLYPDMATSLLMPLRQRIRDIHALEADFVFLQNFTKSYAVRKAAEFVHFLKTLFPGLLSLHVGENFRFGEGRRGNIETLRETCKATGIELQALKREIMDGLAISSSRIRAALMEGSIHEVNAMLGHPYTASGRIIRGKGLGREIGFPTLNVAWHPEVLPRFGVYRVNLRREGGGATLPGIANYGLRPTVGVTPDPLLEVHLLDGNDIPSERDPVKVELVKFIRPEKTFDSVEALRGQIGLDVERVRRDIGPGYGAPR